ncbi:hypothetical protein HPB48_006064 [Haemaphysalis longicornis]|uniref:Uncharacterized protein n=1 Tax=Haemaphysalis longicornis TaxID=44386 RepID=A0A9J6FUE9_HAELO|nr:hypothetical protein HPB48_006064 [Haemaphysalis longicornis]
MYVESQQSNSKMTDAAQLNKSIYLTFCTAVYVEAALNSVLLLLRAPTFVEILRMLCGLLVEADFGVPPRLQRQMQRFAWKAAIAFLNVVLHIYSDFGTALLVDDWRQLEPFFKNVAISHAFLGVPFLSFMCVSTRLWFMYISQAVALCVACIHRSLGCCLRSRSTPNRRKALLVDRMRVQLGLLGSCVKLASWLLGPSLLYAYAYSVPILCAAAYYTIVPELKFRIRLFFLFFWMLHWLSILLPVITAQRMKRAVRGTFHAWRARAIARDSCHWEPTRFGLPPVRATNVYNHACKEGFTAMLIQMQESKLTAIGPCCSS